MATVLLDTPAMPSAHRAALDFLLGRVNYERQAVVPYREANFRLDRMRELLARLGSPHVGQRIVHVAGTKGKGSTATLIASMLSHAGKRTALYTSPHLDRVEERFAVDGQSCSADELASLVESVRPVVAGLDAEESAAGRHGPTYFEVTTAMALLHFARRGVDATVLEVGLGGRLDSTNVCQPLVSVITSISFDHMEQLGNTLAEIAYEKAGIIKSGVPVVSGVTTDEPREVIRRIAGEWNCSLVELGRDFAVDYCPPHHLDDDPRPGTIDFWHRGGGPNWQIQAAALGLVGNHQAANAAVALATICELRQLGWQFSDDAIRSALASARCPARVEVVSRQPTVVLDAAHNVAAVEALVRALDECFSARRRVLVFATTKCKDYRGMLEQLVPRFDDVILTRYRNNPRGVPTEELFDAASAHAGGRVHACATPEEAWSAAQALANRDALICITGSFFIAAEIRLILAGGSAAVGDRPVQK
ncbi:MAG: folylpolyglutamate synthase/dihydrofolate synthase family protein [Pirellulales bacterium]